jgi:hypothetical protein
MEFMSEGNMVSISPTVTIDISRIPGKLKMYISCADCSPEEIQIYTDLFKEFHDVFSWSYEEMPGIDPRIVEHEIKTLSWMLNLFDNDLELLILGRPLLLRQRWRNYLMLVSSTSSLD